jgi:Ubiquitin-activating enzyme E1 FCCH domain
MTIAGRPRLLRLSVAPLAAVGALFAMVASAHTPNPGHSTTGTVTCAAAEIGVNTSTTCTVVILDTAPAAQRATPLGSVTFSSSLAATFAGNPCTLAALVAGQSSSCSVTFTGTAVGLHTITATYPQTLQGGHRWEADAPTTTVRVLARPTVAKSVSPSPQGVDLYSALTLTLSNSNSVPIVGVAFTDTYPGGLVNAATPGASTTCGGAVTAASGGGTVQLSGGTIPAGGSCIVTVSVTSATAGSYTNTLPVGAVSSTNAGQNTVAASATVVYLERPLVAKSFSPATIPVSGVSLLTITLSNSNALAIAGVAFVDIYPAGLSNASGAATSCSGTASTPSAGSVQLVGGIIPAGGNCTVTVSVTSAIAGSYPNSIAVGDVSSTNGGPNTLAASATVIVAPVVTAFDAVEAGAVPRTNLYTKLSGVGFSIDILALDAADAVSTGYTGTVALALVDASTGGGVCASMTSVQALGNLTFAGADAGRKAVAINYANALANARIRIVESGLGITSCSFDAFAIRPAALSVISNMTNATTSGTPVARAGENFTLTATAIPGYTGTPVVDGGRLDAHAGAIQDGTLSGTFSAAVGATGIAQGTSFTYSEVGNFQFLSQGVLDETFTAVDQPGDCTDDFSNTSVGARYGCKFGNAAPTSYFGRFTPDHFMLSGAALTNRAGAGCAPVSTFTYMDEPIGIAFTLTAQNSTNATTRNYTTASGFAKLNAAVPASFSFAARDGGVASMRSAAITAITKANPGQVTTAAAHNYVNGDRVTLTRVSGMSEINGLTVTVSVVDATRFTIGVDTSGAGFSAYASGGMTSRLAGLSSNGTWIAGSADILATARLERSVTPDGPFASLTVGIAPRDSDGIGVLAALLNLDADDDAIDDSIGLGTAASRFGRLRLGNAYGSARLDLPLPLTAEYYDGNFFVTNALDSCTALNASDIRFDFLGGTPKLVACETQMSPTGSIAFAAGRAAAKLTAPGTGNEGAVDLTVNLGAASGSTCTSGSSGAATGAGKTWLQGNWGGGTYISDPRARATFGIYKNANEFIYFQENF